MKKVKITLKINDYTLNTDGFINNNILSFYDNDELTTNIIYDFNNDLLIRDNKEINIKIKFKEEPNNIEYFLKEANCKAYNQLNNYKLLKEKTSVIINYQIEENNFHLNLSYKEEEHD